MASFPPDSAVVAAVCPSPNHGPRKEGRAPDAIILHYTGMESEDAALEASLRSCDRGLLSLSHPREWRGSPARAEGRRAWHAGVSSWAGETDMNSASIGIEIANGGHDFGMPAYPDVQIAALIALCRDIVEPPQNSGAPHSRPFRHCADCASEIPASIFLGARSPKPASVLMSCRRLAGRMRRSTLARAATMSRSCKECSPTTAMTSASTGFTERRLRRSSRRFSGISGRSESMERPISRLSRRCENY